MLKRTKNQFEFYLSKCKEVGLIVTEQRKNILKVIFESSDHPTADTIYERTSIIDQNISLATIYRAINLFEGYGLIEKLEFGDGRARYEMKHDENDHHHHLIDLSSGKIVEFHDEEIERLKHKIAEKLGYKLVEHRLELFGVPLVEESEDISTKNKVK